MELMSRRVSVSIGGVSYDDMIEYVSQQIATVSGITGIEGAGDIIITQSGGVTYVDGTDLIAEDGDLVDGGLLVR